jgi:hypothetical protein
MLFKRFFLTLFIALQVLASASLATAQGTKPPVYLGRRSTDPSACVRITDYYYNTFKVCTDRAANTWSALGGTGVDYALYLDETYHQHVNHGYFWNRGAAAATEFFWEAWVSPKTGAEYVISDGYGGAHNLLWGFNGFGTGKGTVSGNVAIAGAPVGFASQDFIYEGDWHIIGLAWDGTNIRTYTDGVLSSVTALAGVRQTLGNPSEGVLFVGGSDHSNYHGYIRMIRGFEGWNPIGAGLYYRPEINFKAAFNSTGDALLGASFLADYTRPANIIPDLSSGYNGSVHPGYLASELDGSNTGTIDGGNPASGRLNNLPIFTTDNPFVRPTTYRGTTASIPVGAVGYDDFSRANVNLTWDDALTLGTNRTGQVWSSPAAASSGWGIVDGHAYCNNAAGVPSIATFDLGKANQDVTINRKTAATFAGPVGRYTDVNNYVHVEMFVSGADEYVLLWEVVAGVATQLDSALTGGSANNIRLEITGTTAKVYVNGSGTPLITETISLATGNRVGMQSDQILTRVKSIVAY